MTLVANAQDHSFKDKIYLNNGSVLNGKLIKYNMADTVYFAISDIEIMRFPGKMVKKVKMSSSSASEEEFFKFRYPTWYIRTQVSMLYSKSNQGMSLTVSGGYQFNYWLTAGIGAGIDNYYTAAGQNIYPVFGEIRASLFKKNKTPYFAMRTGYGFISPDENNGQSYAKGSFLFNPVFGYRLGGGRPNIDLFAGVRFQSARYTTTDSWSSSQKDIDFRRYDIGLGMTF